MTEAGRNYLDAHSRILLDIGKAEQKATAGQAAPRGQLRLNVSVAFGTRQVVTLMGEFA